MNAIIRTSLCLAALAAPVGFCAEPASGKVLLIDYDRLIEGEILRAGDKFRIRHGAGEMTIPAAPNMVLVADKEAAYQLVKSRIKPGDVLERVRLARWCLNNQLKQHAIEEAEAALALQPDDRSLKAFRDDLKMQISLAPPPSLPESRPLAKLAPPEPATVDVNPESFGVFATKVQPLLMNACAQCHAGESGGAFRLTRASATFGDKRATQLNIAAASVFLNRDQPSASPLLQRAITIHGDCARPPLRDRQTPAYKYLEEWARLATGKSLTPAPAPPPAALPADAVAEASPLAPEPPQRGKATPPAVVLPALANGGNEKVIPAKTPDKAPLEEPMKTEPSDPFDPILFNKQKPK